MDINDHMELLKFRIRKHGTTTQNSESRLKHYPVYAARQIISFRLPNNLADLRDISDEIMQNLNKLPSAAASTRAMRPCLFCQNSESGNSVQQLKIQNQD
jgi:hypothetical protein